MLGRLDLLGCSFAYQMKEFRRDSVSCCLHKRGWPLVIFWFRATSISLYTFSGRIEIIETKPIRSVD